jgi:hypothetical protein
MYIPLLTEPSIRKVFEEGRLDGWGITADQLPEEDVYGRLIKNGRFDTGAEDYQRDAPVQWIMANDDPEVTREQLDIIEDARGFCSTFLQEQLGDEGEMLDFTNLPNRMSKLMEVK